MKARPSAWLRGLAHEERGTASVELVILLPAFIFVMASSIEASILMMRATLLDRGLDIAVRELRLGTGDPPSFEEFRVAICEGAALLRDCERSLQVELRPVSALGTAPLDAEARCLDRREDIAALAEASPEHYRAGTGNELMMVRACLVADPLLPSYGLGALLPKDPSGGYRLLAVSAFVQEPAGSQRGAGT